MGACMDGTQNDWTNDRGLENPDNVSILSPHSIFHRKSRSGLSEFKIVQAIILWCHRYGLKRLNMESLFNLVLKGVIHINVQVHYSCGLNNKNYTEKQTMVYINVKAYTNPRYTAYSTLEWTLNRYRQVINYMCQPTHDITPYFFNIHFDIIVPSMPMSPFRFSD
jgi:hypothetical protein